MSATFVLVLISGAFLQSEDVPKIQIGGNSVAPAAWQFLRLTRGLSDQATPEQLAQLQEQLIDRELIRRYLDQQKVSAPETLIELRVHELESLMQRAGVEPGNLLAKVGLTPEAVRQELALGAAWETWIEQSVTQKQLQQYFQDHQPELDGTRVRVRQIFRSATRDEDAQAAANLLKNLSLQISGGKISFETAARQHSQSPSRERGGDVGWIIGLNQLPEEVSRAVLKLDAGQLAAPIRSSLGVHLVQVTERQPGQLSLEDVRPQILEQMARARWQELTTQLRKTTPIQRAATP